jgi:hypothetical protein
MTTYFLYCLNFHEGLQNNNQKWCISFERRHDTQHDDVQYGMPTVAMPNVGMRDFLALP